MLYLDSSAIIKLYISEDFSSEVINLVQNSKSLITSQFAYTEIHSAFSRLYRQKIIDYKLLEIIKFRFEKDWIYIKTLELNGLIIKRASELIYQHELRSFDSIHLAFVENLSNIIGSEFYFITFDKRLSKASIALNIQTLTDDNFMINN
jgi:predicted nucleic acid-binding protein